MRPTTHCRARHLGGTTLHTRASGAEVTWLQQKFTFRSSRLLLLLLLRRLLPRLEWLPRKVLKGVEGRRLVGSAGAAVGRRGARAVGVLLAARRLLVVRGGRGRGVALLLTRHGAAGLPPRLCSTQRTTASTLLPSDPPQGFGQDWLGANKLRCKLIQQHNALAAKPFTQSAPFSHQQHCAEHLTQCFVKP